MSPHKWSGGTIYVRDNWSGQTTYAVINGPPRPLMPKQNGLGPGMHAAPVGI